MSTNITPEEHKDYEILYKENSETPGASPDKSSKKKKGLAAIGGAILVALAKFKTVLLILLGKLKFLYIILKFGKLFTSFGSMLLMIWVYARMYGLAFGIGFVVLLLAHEMGHYFEARKLDLDVSLPLFIPFVGALINMKEAPTDAVTEAKIALGGPLLGSLASFICLFFYYQTKQDFYLALCYTGTILNLFNLIPVHPIDGGRIVTAISPKIWLIGVPLTVVMLFKFFNPIIILLLILGVVEIYKYYKAEEKKYYDVELKSKIYFVIAYFGLIAALGITASIIHSTQGINL